ncbi:MAG: septal ring lytic transglycosylase RlpA family protein [Pseudomonadota bacterium]
MTIRAHLPLLAIAVSAYLAGCSSAPPTAQAPAKPAKAANAIPPYKGGGYYKDDGPGLNPPDNLAAVPDAEPRQEPLHAFANNPYRVLGKSYKPMTSNVGYKAEGKASWYGRKFHGKPTSSGEPYDMYAMTAAHPTLPIPSYARVTNPESGKSVVVRINDRGPFHDGRLIDLSYTAAYKLDVLKGVTPVTVEAVLPETAPTSFVAQAAEKVVEPRVEPATLVVADTGAKPAEPTVVPADQAVATVAEPASATAYYLQLGAFSSQARANDMLDRITARLSSTFPGVMRLAVDGLYKVQAGPFSSYEEADRAATLLHQEMGIKSFKVMGDRRSAANEPASAPSIQGGYYLQLAAVSSAMAAERLGERVKARFGEELPGLAQVQSGNLYKVQAGPFASPAAAQRLSLAYQQDFGSRPYPLTR